MKLDHVTVSSIAQVTRICRNARPAGGGRSEPHSVGLEDGQAHASRSLLQNAAYRHALREMVHGGPSRGNQRPLPKVREDQSWSRFERCRRALLRHIPECDAGRKRWLRQMFSIGPCEATVATPSGRTADLTGCYKACAAWILIAWRGKP